MYVPVDLVEFTDEEGYGKYLDLHEVYDKFLNLRGVEVWSECDVLHTLSFYISGQIRSRGDESIAPLRKKVSLINCVWIKSYFGMKG